MGEQDKKAVQLIFTQNWGKKIWNYARGGWNTSYSLQ